MPHKDRPGGLRVGDQVRIDQLPQGLVEFLDHSEKEYAAVEDPALRSRLDSGMKFIESIPGRLGEVSAVEQDYIIVNFRERGELPIQLSDDIRTADGFRMVFRPEDLVRHEQAAPPSTSKDLDVEHYDARIKELLAKEKSEGLTPDDESTLKLLLQTSRALNVRHIMARMVRSA